MNAGYISILVTAALGLLTFSRTQNRQLTRLDTETQILERLDRVDHDSQSTNAMREVVDAHVTELRADLHMGRDWESSMFLGFVYLILASTGLYLFGRDTLWVRGLGIVAGVLALGAYGLAFRTARRVPRNRDGSRRT